MYSIRNAKIEDRDECLRIQHQNGIQSDEYLWDEYKWAFVLNNLYDSWVLIHDEKVVGYAVGLIRTITEQDYFPSDLQGEIGWYYMDLCVEKPHRHEGTDTIVSFVNDRYPLNYAHIQVDNIGVWKAALRNGWEKIGLVKNYFDSGDAYTIINDQ